jgi:hypothetical protein
MNGNHGWYTCNRCAFMRIFINMSEVPPEVLGFISDEGDANSPANSGHGVERRCREWWLLPKLMTRYLPPCNGDGFCIGDERLTIDAEDQSDFTSKSTDSFCSFCP